MRDMRRFKQLLPEEDTIKVLENNTAGVLAVTGDDDYPYAVPVSYVYAGGKIYIHSALEGNKVDGVRRSDKASFCVIDEDRIVPEEYTTYFRSAIAFGRPRIVEDAAEKKFALEELGRKYYPGDTPENLDKTINNENARVCVIALDIDRLTGKEAIEFVREKEADC